MFPRRSDRCNPTVTADIIVATEQIYQYNDLLLKNSPRALCYRFSLPPLLLWQEFVQSHYWSYFTTALKSLQSNRIYRLSIQKTLEGGAKWASTARKSASNCLLVINSVAVVLMTIPRQHPKMFLGLQFVQQIITFLNFFIFCIQLVNSQ